MDLTIEQARKLQPIVGRHLRFLGKLCRRLDALQVDPSSPMWIAAHRAYDGMHHLSVELHYATCPSGVAKDMGHLPDCSTPPGSDTLPA